MPQKNKLVPVEEVEGGIENLADVLPDSEPKAGKRAVAFCNWEIPLKDGKVLKSSKGFAIFQNPQFPNRGEDILVALAQKHDGKVELTMNVRIVMNNSVPAAEFDIESIELPDTDE